MLNQAINTDFLSYCSDKRCWLTRYEYLSACAICSTKDQKAPQHMENRFCHYKSMFCQFMLNRAMNTHFLILLQWHSVLTDLIWIAFHLRNMLQQEPEGSSTPGKQVLPLWYVNVLATDTESNHEYRLSDPTAMTIGADWLDLNTFPPAEYVVRRTRRLLNSWKTGFSVMESQMFWPFLLNQTTNTDILILLLWHFVLTDSIWIPFHLRNMLYQGPEGSSTPGKHVLPLWQVNVLAPYTESNHEYRLPDPTAVAIRGDWLDLSTFLPA